ncbi:uncharacterized protein LOC117323612 isoform X2 [Pecten maximus]|uniref:uncharacterized protein LOC117323612 isoform X2 n=1 Tax=Pecten maximus TaxID=6579 RepID=UPI001458436E|nr:uncharacterized protein LOC117323612 isoform X2 [Pecten maximus]
MSASSGNVAGSQRISAENTFKEFISYTSKSTLKSVAYASFPGAICYILTSNQNLSKRIFYGLTSVAFLRYLCLYANKEMSKSGVSMKDLITMDDD